MTIANGAKVKRRTAAQLVADELRRRIAGGVIGEGEPLLQEALANELGVSRIPVREALKELEAEGFVVLTSHKSAIVSKLSGNEISELFELREMLEPWLLGLAMPNIGQDDIARAERFIEQMRSTKGPEDWGTLNWGFHEALYAPSRRSETLRILQRIHGNMDRYVRLQISLTSGQEQAHREHEEILLQVRRGDTARALAALTEHIRGVHQALVDGLRRSAAEPAPS